jgi:hypothetical protein
MRSRGPQMTMNPGACKSLDLAIRTMSDIAFHPAAIRSPHAPSRDEWQDVTGQCLSSQITFFAGGRNIFHRRDRRAACALTPRHSRPRQIAAGHGRTLSGRCPELRKFLHRSTSSPTGFHRQPKGIRAVSCPLAGIFPFRISCSSRFRPPALSSTT